MSARMPGSRASHWSTGAVIGSGSTPDYAGGSIRKAQSQPGYRQCGGASTVERGKDGSPKVCRWLLSRNAGGWSKLRDLSPVTEVSRRRRLVVPSIAAAIVASICGWIVDAAIEPFMGIERPDLLGAASPRSLRLRAHLAAEVKGRQQKPSAHQGHRRRRKLRSENWSLRQCAARQELPSRSRGAARTPPIWVRSGEGMPVA